MSFSELPAGGTPSPLVLPAGRTIGDLDFAKLGGLVPAVVQDAGTGRVLMVGFQDADALQQTLDTGLATFRSRSRGGRWVKGETSGHVLRVRAIEVDCDADTVLLHANPAGPTCHTGAVSCFDVGAGAGGDDTEIAPGAGAAAGEVTGAFLARLDDLVADRARERPAGSYTTRLLDAGVARVAQKVGEEGVEVALAAVTEDDAGLTGEAADLLYHLLVLLRSRGLGLADVETVLRQRHD